MSDLNIGNPGVCKHGQLARQCELCEKDERIAELERQLAEKKQRIKQLEVGND